MFVIPIIIQIRYSRDAKNEKLNIEKEYDVLEAVVERKKIELEATPWGMKFSVYVAVTTVSVAAAGALAYFGTQNIIISIIVAPVGMFVSNVIASIKESRMKTVFESNYLRALSYMSASVSAGLSITEAVQDLLKSPYIDSYVLGQFQEVASDIRVGIPVDKAFESFAERTKSSDAEDVAIAMSIQTKVGGDLSLMLSTIIRDVGSRIATRKEAKTIMASTSLMINIMDVVPFLFILFMAIGMPGHFDMFFESLYMTLVFAGIIGFMLVGTIIMRRMVKRMKERSKI
jgi:tight adherence protein B